MPLRLLLWRRTLSSLRLRGRLLATVRLSLYARRLLVLRVEGVGRRRDVD
jgi:hypothetical protein